MNNFSNDNQASAVKDPSIIESFMASLSHELDSYEKSIAQYAELMGVQRGKLNTVLNQTAPPDDRKPSPGVGEVAKPGDMAQHLVRQIERFNFLNATMFEKNNDLNSLNVHLFKIF